MDRRVRAARGSRAPPAARLGGCRRRWRRDAITPAMTAATSSALCALGSARESGPPCTALTPNSVPHHPGDTSETWMPGCVGLQLVAQVGGEGVQEVLGAAVGRAERRQRHPAEHRRHVDDVAAAPRLEVRQHRLDAVERRLHVDPHHLVDVVVGELGRRTGDAAADVVDPDVDVAGPRERRRPPRAGRRRGWSRRRRRARAAPQRARPRPARRRAGRPAPPSALARPASRPAPRRCRCWLR